jgi:light-regulated signal transduction histidine kinase (bacteriophytochrome)
MDETKPELVIDNDKKQQVALNLLNAIFKHLNKPEISILTDFHKTDREDLIKPEITKIIESYKDDLLQYFDKNVFYRRAAIKGFPLAMIRKICQELGFKFKYFQKTKCVNSHIKNHMYYFITKKE